MTAAGAQGSAGDPDHDGARDAQVEGTFSLTAGDTFQLLVGGAGTAFRPDADNGNGVCGGSFFLCMSDIPSLKAGGGGSFNSGLDIFALAGMGYGHGSLTIKFPGDDIAPIPLPAPLPLLLADLVGMRLMPKKSQG